VVLIAVVILLSISQKPAQSVGAARIGQALSNFKLSDINGQEVELADFTGKVVLVNAWATWCPPCKAEMPDLNAYYQAHREEGFELLAVNGGDTLSQASAFAQQTNLAFPVLLDQDLRVLNGLGIHSYPTSILVGRDGVVKGIHQGMFSPESLEAEVTPLIQEQ